jgi:hypothetical protein
MTASGRSMKRYAVAVLLLSGACTPMRMPVPAPLAETPEWRVEWLRGRRMRFGPYEAHQITERNRARGGILDALTGKHEYQQRYEFMLRDTSGSADLLQVRCDHRDVERGVGIRGVQIQLADRASLECTVNPPGDPSQPWTLRLGRQGDRMPRGTLSQEAADSSGYEVRAETHDGGGCCEVAGYLIRREERVLVSIDRSDRGWIRLASAAGDRERPLLAAGAAALLIANEMSAAR